jgi:hypothetical protein
VKREIDTAVVIVVRGRVDKTHKTAWMLGLRRVPSFQNADGKTEEEGRQGQLREFGTWFS